MTTATLENGLHCYYPEMNEPKPVAEIDATLSHYGKHWFLKTRLSLKGRGVQFVRTLESKDLVPQAQHKIGMHEYKVTEAAFGRICKEHRVCSESLL